MAFNKYTQITPAQYDARSLQETLYLPTLKRQQHDQMSQNLAETDAALNQYDSLDFQSELVNQEKEKLREQLDNQASQLATQGIKSGSKSQFLDLASKFSEATSINGTIGKAKQIKDNYLQNRARITENMVKAGYSPDDAQKFLDTQFEKYKEDWDGENLNEIELYDAPKYMDIQEEFSKLKPLMGKNIESKMAESGYEIGVDDGHFVYKTKSGQVHRESNDEQLQYALAQLNNTFLAEGSKGKASLNVQGISEEAAAGKINNLMGLASTNIVRDTTQDNYRFAQRNLNRGRSTDLETKDLNLGGNKISQSPTSMGFESFKDLKAKSTIENSNDKEQVIKARKNQKILDAVISKASSMPEYTNISNKITESQNNINNKIPEEHQKIIEDIGLRSFLTGSFSKEQNDYLKDYLEDKEGSYKDIMDPIKESASSIQKEYFKINEYENQLEDLYNSIMDEQVVTTMEYNILDKSKDRKERLESIGPIMGDMEQSEVTGISIQKNNDDIVKVDLKENQKLIDVLRRNFNDNNFKDSEIVKTSLVKDDMSQGIKIAIQMGEDDVKEGIYEDSELEEGETVSIMISPKDLQNGEVPTYLAQYLNQNYGTKGVRDFQNKILDNKYPATTNIDEIGMNSINTKDLFFGGDKNEDIDFLGKSKLVNGNSLKIETPYIIKEEGNPGNSTITKEPMTLKNYMDKTKNSDFKISDPDFIMLVKDFYNDLIKFEVLGEDYKNNSFEKEYEERDENGIMIDEDKLNDLIEEIKNYDLIFSESDSKARMIKLAQKYKNI